MIKLAGQRHNNSEHQDFVKDLLTMNAQHIAAGFIPGDIKVYDRKTLKLKMVPPAFKLILILCLTISYVYLQILILFRIWIMATHFSIWSLQKSIWSALLAMKSKFGR